MNDRAVTPERHMSIHESSIVDDDDRVDVINTNDTSRSERISFGSGVLRRSNPQPSVIPRWVNISTASHLATDDSKNG